MDLQDRPLRRTAWVRYVGEPAWIGIIVGVYESGPGWKVHVVDPATGETMFDPRTGRTDERVLRDADLKRLSWSEIPEFRRGPAPADEISASQRPQ